MRTCARVLLTHNIKARKRRQRAAEENREINRRRQRLTNRRRRSTAGNGGRERRWRAAAESGGGERRRREAAERGGGERRRREAAERGGGEQRRREVAESGGGERRRREVAKRGGGERRRREAAERGGEERRWREAAERGGRERRWRALAATATVATARSLSQLSVPDVALIVSCRGTAFEGYSPAIISNGLGGDVIDMLDVNDLEKLMESMAISTNHRLVLKATFSAWKQNPDKAFEALATAKVAGRARVLFISLCMIAGRSRQESRTRGS
jgi:hypothetical protein